MAHHLPLENLLGSSNTPALNIILATPYANGHTEANGSVAGPTVFRRPDGQRYVSVAVTGVDSTDGQVAQPTPATDFVVALERSLDQGFTWVKIKDYTGPTTEDLPYVAGGILWRFKLTTKGAGAGVLVQAIC